MNITFGSVKQNYILPENSENHPFSLTLGNHDVINRGRVINHDGNKGVVINFIRYPEKSERERYFISIFWFEGPLYSSAEESDDNIRAYSLNEFLTFLGHTLETAS